MMEHEDLRGGDHCPLTGREVGELIGTLKAIQQDLSEIKALVASHEAELNKARGMVWLIGLFAAVIGGVIGRLWK